MCAESINMGTNQNFDAELLIRGITPDPCRIWDSHSGGYEEFCLLEYNAL
jgi:hypothetical protein